ncbi:Phosphatidylglycerol/phosphatidylinositol transfer protein [Terramyces sp. JEL0728]|nr:Phosphatidylglycerol/phosphatidylinositol transfer protein [Terramyces sp. JEL0728]
MKFIAIASVVTAAATPFTHGNIKDDSSNNANPLKSCGDKSDIFKLADITLTPYPIKIGQDVHVNANGTLSAPIQNGTTITFTVKALGIPFFSKTEDFCTQAKKANKTCPIPAGSQDVQASQEVSSLIPSGTYNVEIKVNDANNTEIACMSGDLKFEK